MSYQVDTKNAYRNNVKANAYLGQYTHGFKWARFTMWKQKKIVDNYLNICNLGNSDIVLDIPCGAGYIGGILSKYNCSVIASDISMQMMKLGVDEYSDVHFKGFIQSDITSTPFESKQFKCIVVLSLMHRLPTEIRMQVLSELSRIGSKYLIISYSVESILQRLKIGFLSMLSSKYKPAPASIPMKVILDELNSFGFVVKKRKRIVNLLSSKVVFLVAN